MVFGVLTHSFPDTVAHVTHNNNNLKNEKKNRLNKQTGKRINDEFNVHLPHAKLFRRNVIILKKKKSHKEKRIRKKQKTYNYIHININTYGKGY